MSIHVMSEVWRYSSARGIDLFLLVAIADNVSTESRAGWPGQEYLARKIRVDKRTVMRGMARLEKKGELVVHRRPGKSSILQVRSYEGCRDLLKTNSDRAVTGVAESHHTSDTAVAYEPSGIVKSSKALSQEERDRVWDGLVEVFGAPATEAAKRRRGRVARSLAHAGATHPEIVARALAWPAHFGDATLTEEALEKHWTALGRPPLRKTTRGRRYGYGLTADEILEQAAETRRKEEEDEAFRGRNGGGLAGGGLPEGGLRPRDQDPVD